MWFHSKLYLTQLTTLLVTLFIILSFSLIFAQNKGTSDIKSIELATKQANKGLRFISADGRFTFYQKNDGALYLSMNYSLQEVLKGPSGSIFGVITSPTRKKIVVSMDPFYFNSNRQNHPSLIYTLDWEGIKAIPIGEGLSPKLHLQDHWVSFYLPESKKIIFKSLQKQTIFTVNILSANNPYFIPQTIMVRDSDILYTDINKKGENGIFIIDRNGKKVYLLFSNSTPGVKIELCLNSQNILYIGEFGYPGSKFKSRISTLNLNQTRNFNDLKVIYTSEKQDPGNIVCQSAKGDLYFSQNQSDEKLPALFYSEIVKLNPTTKAVMNVSNLQYATQVINMDGRILIPYNGKFYIIEGDAENSIKDQLSPRILNENNKVSK